MAFNTPLCVLNDRLGQSAMSANNSYREIYKLLEGKTPIMVIVDGSKSLDDLILQVREFCDSLERARSVVFEYETRGIPLKDE